MRQLSVHFLLFFLLALPASPAFAAKEQEIAEGMINRSNNVVEQLGALKQEGQLTNQAALAVIQSDMSPILNFSQLTKRALGKHWRRIDEAVRQEITEAFRMLLENTYAKVLAQYSGHQVKLLEAKAQAGDKIAVLIQVYDDAKSADISYIFEANEAGEYLVSDIKVEGISLVANYRRQFSAVIGKSGAEGLVAKLTALAKEKIQ